MALEDRVRELAAEVEPADAAAAEAARELHRRLLKPPGSLGRLEDLGARLAGMAGRSPPPVPENPAVVVCAGDHGVLARGVSPWPEEVTAAMVGSFCAGGAAVNALAGTVGARVSVLDVGIASDLERHPRLRDAKVRAGTDDLSEGPAMSREEAARAVLAGAGVAEELVESGGVDLLVTGDMGIGNTTPAACLVAAFTGRPAGEVTGRGTGIDDATLEVKTAVVDRALGLHDPDPADPIGVLGAVGGLEHAALVGVILMGAVYGVPVLLDGVVSNSAALVARSLAANSTDYLVAGHLSVEPGAAVAMRKLGLEPLLDLRMRLGEGTGGLLAVPLVQAAARVMAEMGTLEEAGIA
ncbi:MAG TPA: nicotinate-nucleotide--dimethylbenzimidazole phosphoribosyltransferase [Thermoanaerobaculia bacterium]|nr:nicotinate-nucleotide--dimethylbenzimidazole phosphoribosyltransferase [Thermoanaerobaculia bacterium]